MKNEVNGLVAKNVLPYVGVQFDKNVTFKTPNGDRTFRIITYQAYNAFGLIGSEYNGVAILDEENHSVLCDNIAKEATGYFGVSEKQLKMAEDILKKNWVDFQIFVNWEERSRYKI